MTTHNKQVTRRSGGFKLSRPLSARNRRRLIAAGKIPLLAEHRRPKSTIKGKESGIIFTEYPIIAETTEKEINHAK